MLLLLPLLFTLALAEQRSVHVQGSVFCQDGDKRFIPKATVIVVKADKRGKSKHVNGTSVDKKGKFDFVATVDQDWPGRATRVQIYLECNEDNQKHCLKRFSTSETCKMTGNCERYTERAIAPSFYHTAERAHSARLFTMHNENLSEMQFYLRESVACRASQLYN